MSKYLFLAVCVVLILVMAFSCVASQDPAPAEPAGIELDIDRAKPRPPLKQPKAPKPAKGAKR